MVDRLASALAGRTSLSSRNRSKTSPFQPKPELSDRRRCCSSSPGVGFAALVSAPLGEPNLRSENGGGADGEVSGRLLCQAGQEEEEDDGERPREGAGQRARGAGQEEQEGEEQQKREPGRAGGEGEAADAQLSLEPASARLLLH